MSSGSLGGSRRGCGSREEIEEAVLRVVCGSKAPLTFEEVYARVSELCGGVDKFRVRDALATLVRTGRVTRLRGDDVRGVPRMVFACAKG